MKVLPATIESVVGAILSFLSKAVGFVAKHTWALIVAVARVIGLWLMQKVNKKIRSSVQVGQTYKIDLVKMREGWDHHSFCSVPFKESVYNKTELYKRKGQLYYKDLIPLKLP